MSTKPNNNTHTNQRQQSCRWYCTAPCAQVAQVNAFDDLHTVSRNSLRKLRYSIDKWYTNLQVMASHTFVTMPAPLRALTAAFVCLSYPFPLTFGPCTFSSNSCWPPLIRSTPLPQVVSQSSIPSPATPSATAGVGRDAMHIEYQQQDGKLMACSGHRPYNSDHPPRSETASQWVVQSARDWRNNSFFRSVSGEPSMDHPSQRCLIPFVQFPRLIAGWPATWVHGRQRMDRMLEDDEPQPMNAYAATRAFLRHDRTVNIEPRMVRELQKSNFHWMSNFHRLRIKDGQVPG